MRCDLLDRCIPICTWLVHALAWRRDHHFAAVYGEKRRLLSCRPVEAGKGLGWPGNESVSLASRRAGGRAASCRRMNRQRPRHATCDEPSQRIEKGMDEIVIMLALNPLMAALTLSLARLSRES